VGGDAVKVEHGENTGFLLLSGFMMIEVELIRSCTCSLRINTAGSPIDHYRDKKF
jgi:hypothetical protein